MYKLPPCPRQLNSRVVADMKKRGIANHLIAKYFNNLSKAASESDSQLFSTPQDIVHTHAKEIAFVFISDYLRRKNLNLTINTILNEGELSNDGPSILHIKELKINREMPPIQTLIRQRLVDETEVGWFEIDSQVTQTIGQHSSSVPGTTFSVSKYVNKLSNESQIAPELIGYARPRGPPLKSPLRNVASSKEQKQKKSKKSKTSHKGSEKKEQDDFLLDGFSIHTKSINASVSTRLKQAYDLKSANSQISKFQLNDFLSIDF